MNPLKGVNTPGERNGKIPDVHVSRVAQDGKDLKAGTLQNKKIMKKRSQL